MNQKAIIAILVFFVILVAGMFSFAYLKKAEISEENTEVANPEPEVKYASITRIEGKHYFIDGVHTIVGELAMPTPCDLLETNSHVTDSDPQRVVLDFTVINNADFCAEQVTAQRFKISVTADADATFQALFMGRAVDLNLIPAAPGETPDDFEVFIKG